MNPHKRRHSRWKLSQELKGKLATFFAKYTCMEMASRKILIYQNKAKNLYTIYFVFGLEMQIHLNKTLYWLKKYVFLSCHLGWMNRRRFCLQKGGNQEHISLITIMFCFNEFAFTVQVKHKMNSKLIQILGFILICLYFTTGHFRTCTLQRI